MQARFPQASPEQEPFLNECIALQDEDRLLDLKLLMFPDGTWACGSWIHVGTGMTYHFDDDYFTE